MDNDEKDDGYGKLLADNDWPEESQVFGEIKEDPESVDLLQQFKFYYSIYQ